MREWGGGKKKKRKLGGREDTNHDTRLDEFDNFLGELRIAVDVGVGELSPVGVGV